MAERIKNEEEASVSPQQFEALAGFGDLGLNVEKTETMECRIKKAEVSEEVENAMMGVDSASKMESRVGHFRLE